MNPPPPQAASTEQPLKMPDGIPNPAEAVTGLKDTLTKTVSSFTEPGAPGDYNFSNTIIAKFAFVIFIIIAFFYVMGLGIGFLSWVFSPPSNPYIVKGFIDSTKGVKISQNPESKDSVLLLRSNNKNKGIEFTYSTWIYINDLNNAKTYQHIFNKGDNNYDPGTGLAKINNAPGLYLGRNSSNTTATLHVIMDTVSASDPNNVIDIDDIPLRKWVNIVLRVSNTVMDVYVNGTVSGRLVFNNVPKQNYNDIFICQNGGFSGKLSDLRYFSYSLNVYEINTILNRGPNLNASPLNFDANMSWFGGASYDYLSSSWYTKKI
jgi:hypothetical protein